MLNRDFIVENVSTAVGCMSAAQPIETIYFSAVREKKYFHLNSSSMLIHSPYKDVVI